jgi:hypothetical protein
MEFSSREVYSPLEFRPQKHYVQVEFTLHKVCIPLEFSPKISDNIPDGNANRKIGIVAVVIRETNKGLGASEVISHDAPTSYIAAPTYEKRARDTWPKWLGSESGTDGAGQDELCIQCAAGEDWKS